ncbi:hypothetical protein ACIRJM_03360 [Streptomyces sp. NPDC102405]|uniref:hypothetical protein n=1 Tax=Streptomyces sp. NPDC102405 TaxID=3366170 RepID=UPI00380B89B8
MSMPASAVQLAVKKHLTCSILLWMRTDPPRQTGMDHWKGPHSGIISGSPGLEEYRQIHLAEHNSGAYADEINVFRRTLLYAGPPNSSRWYDVAGPGETVGARVLVQPHRKDGAGAGDPGSSSRSSSSLHSPAPEC